MEGEFVNESTCERAVVSRDGSVQQYLDLLSVFTREMNEQKYSPLHMLLRRIWNHRNVQLEVNSDP